MLNPIGQKIATGSVRQGRVLRRQLSKLAGWLDRHDRSAAPIHLPCSAAELGRLGLSCGSEPGTFLYGQHVVRAAW